MKNSINKRTGGPNLGLKTPLHRVSIFQARSLSLSISALFLLPEAKSTLCLSNRKQIEHQSNPDPTKSKRQPWLGLLSKPPSSPRHPLNPLAPSNSSVVTAARSSRVTLMANSVTTVVKPVSSPFTAPSPLRVSLFPYIVFVFLSLRYLFCLSLEKTSGSVSVFLYDDVLVKTIIMV